MRNTRIQTDRARAAAFWAAPPLLALVLYWPGLTCWFQKDDFAWLGLNQAVANGQGGYWWALFAPLAQGTIRTLSERVFYMSFTTLFGFNPLPFRGWAFLTFAATLPLLTIVCSKLTGSRAAGFWAAILWTAHSSLAVVLSWTAVYYQILCSFNFLLTFWLLLRYVETGQKKFYYAQLATFIIGFTILELNVVYPAIAAAYALCCARHVLTKILPLFSLSALYTILHMAAVRLPSSGPYKMYWDSSVFSTLWWYFKTAMGPNRLILFRIYPSLARSALTAILMAGLIGFLISKIKQRQWVAAFFPAWFLIVVSPFLPLHDHIDDSYLTIPLIGLSMWGGWALACAWRADLLRKITGTALVTIFLCVQIPVGQAVTRSFHDMGEKTRKLVFGVLSLSRNRPDTMVLLSGVDTPLFWDVLFNRPLRLYGLNEVYLALEDRPNILQGRNQPDLSNFFADAVRINNARQENRLIVLDVSAGQIRDVTAAYRGGSETSIPNRNFKEN